MSRRGGHPGRRAPARHRGPYWAGDVVEVTPPASPCCACCGNYANDARCLHCGTRRRSSDTGATDTPSDGGFATQT